MTSHKHIPVLLKEILENLQWGETPTLLDGTLGRGGHTLALLQQSPDLIAVALDQDPEAIKFGKTHYEDWIKSGRLHLFQTNFNHPAFYASLKEKVGFDHFDMILLDLGVSSPQLDNPERGFSFYDKGPLDMRMDTNNELTAATIINDWSEEELVDLFFKYGEIYKPHRVVKAILEDRAHQPFETTDELSDLIARIEGWRRKGHHPATQYFLALRLVVNKELDHVQQAIPLLIPYLKPNGRFFVITFHSLEDRIVKYLFKDHLTVGNLVNKKVIQATWEDKKKNPRARSAKLRIFQKGSE